jgi:hypothetical protein
LDEKQPLCLRIKQCQLPLNVTLIVTAAEKSTALQEMYALSGKALDVCYLEKGLFAHNLANWKG